MLKTSIYEVTDTDKIHLSDEWIDGNGNLVRTLNYTDGDITETRCSYNETGLLISERNYCEDQELDETRYGYDGNENVVLQEYFIAGELYERTFNNHSDGRLEIVMEQDGEEVQRSIRIEDGENHVSEFFENGTQIEKQVYTYNPENRSGEKLVYGEDKNMVLKELIVFDQNDNTIEFKQLNAEGFLLEYEKHIYDGKLLKQSVFKKYVGESAEEHKVSCTYNQRGDITREEVTTLEGNLLGFTQFQYDDEHRLIEEMEFYHSTYNAIYGTYANGKNSRLQYEHVTVTSEIED